MIWISCWICFERANTCRMELLCRFLFMQVFPSALITWIDSVKAQMDIVHWRAFPNHVPFLWWCIINHLQARQTSQGGLLKCQFLFFSSCLVLVRRICCPTLIISTPSLTWPFTFHQRLLWTTLLFSGCKSQVGKTSHTGEKCNGLNQHTQKSLQLPACLNSCSPSSTSCTQPWGP